MAGLLKEISHSLNGSTPSASSIPLEETHTFNLDLVSTYGGQFPSITSDNKAVVLSTLIVGVKDQSDQIKSQSYRIARDPHKMIILNPPLILLGAPIHGGESIKSFFTTSTNDTLKALMYQPFVRNSGNTAFVAGSLSVAQADDLFIPGVNCRIGLSLTYTKTGASLPTTRYANIPVSGTGWESPSATNSSRGVMGGGLPSATATTTGAQRFEMEIFDASTFGTKLRDIFPNDYTLANIKPSSNVTLAIFAYLGERIEVVSSTAPATLAPTWSYNDSSATAYSRTRTRPADTNSVGITVSTIGTANTETLQDSNGIGWVGEYDSNVTTDTTVRIISTANGA